MVYRPNLISVGPPPAASGVKGDHTVDALGNVFIHNGTAWVSANGLQPIGSTGLNGFTLQNATPNIITSNWTAPNDGNMHRALVYATLVVSSTATGGEINVNFTDPGGTARSRILFAASQTAGYYSPNGDTPALPLNIAPNSQIVVQESTALTAGAAVLWCEVWAS